MKEVAGDLDWLAGKMEDKGFRDNVRTFGKDAVAAGILIEGLAKAIGGAVGVSSVYGAWKIIGGALSWIPTAAAIGALGATIMPQPLNEGEYERARQKRFHQGSSGPPMPVGVFPEKVPAKPGSLSDKSAIKFNREDGSASGHEYIPLTGGAASRKDSLSGMQPGFRARLEAMFKDAPAGGQAFSADIDLRPSRRSYLPARIAVDTWLRVRGARITGRGTRPTLRAILPGFISMPLNMARGFRCPMRTGIFRPTPIQKSRCRHGARSRGAGERPKAVSPPSRACLGPWRPPRPYITLQRGSGYREFGGDVCQRRSGVDLRIRRAHARTLSTDSSSRPVSRASGLRVQYSSAADIVTGAGSSAFAAFDLATFFSQ